VKRLTIGHQKDESGSAGFIFRPLCPLRPPRPLPWIPSWHLSLSLYVIDHYYSLILSFFVMILQGNKDVLFTIFWMLSTSDLHAFLFDRAIISGGFLQ
jgi:hypothetical protein